MPALTPYPGESPLDFERRRQAQAGNTVAAGIVPDARPAFDADVARRLFGGGQYGTTAATATWAPYATGGQAGQGDAVPDRFTPTIEPTGYTGWRPSGATMPQGEMGRLLQSGGLRYDPTLFAGVPDRAYGPGEAPTQYAQRLTQTPGLKYDPKLGGGDVVLPFDPRGEGYVTTPRSERPVPPPAPAPARTPVAAPAGTGDAWYNKVMFEDPQFLVREAMRSRGMDPRGLGVVGRYFQKAYGKMLPSFIQALVTGAGAGGLGMTNVEGGMRNFMDALFAGNDGGAGFYNLLSGTADRAVGALPGLAANLSDEEIASQMQQALALRLAGAAPVYSVAAQRGLLGAFEDEQDRYLRTGGQEGAADFTGTKAWQYLSTRPDIAALLGLR